MTGTGTLPPLRDVIARYGLSAEKRFGQHFLLDSNLTERIARAAGPLEGHDILEVGPGPGGLTRSLLKEGAGHVYAVETDSRFIPALQEISDAYPGRLTIIEADALEIDESNILGHPAKVVANLPYNVGTPLLLRWLAAPQQFISMTLMFQKEVANRLSANPGSRSFGRLSVAAQWRFEVGNLFDVNPKAFVPPPKVTSTVVQLVPRSQPLGEADPIILEAVTAVAFGQRRKMLRSSLKSMGVDPLPILDAASIDGRRRAEELSVEEFCTLARGFAAAKSNVHNQAP